MRRFARKYTTKLKELGIAKYVHLMKIYVDDNNLGMLRLERGTKFIEGRLYRPGVGWKGKRLANDLTEEQIVDIKVKADLDNEAEEDIVAEEDERDS